MAIGTRPTRPADLAMATADQDRRHDAGKRARPGLLRADLRHELRTAERATGEIGGDVGRPHDREQKHDGQKSEVRVGAQHDRRHPKRAGIGNAACHPDPPLGRRQRRRRERAHGENDDPPPPGDARAPVPVPAPTRLRRPCSTDRRSAPATSDVHSQNTPIAASAPEQRKRPAADIGDPDRERREHERRARREAQARAAVARDRRTGSASATVTIRFARPSRRTGARDGNIRRSRFSSVARSKSGQ